MPDSLILLALAGLAITIFVLWQRDAYDRGHEEGWNEGYRAAENYYTITRKVNR